MNYFAKKEERKERAQVHHKMMVEKYYRETEESIKNSRVILEDDFQKLINQYMEDMESEYKGVKTFRIIKLGIETYATMKMKKFKNPIILNFASFKNPGGMYMEGSSAQEESICCVSNLYEILSAFDDTYYAHNRTNTNKGLYYNRMIVSPGVVFVDENGDKICTATVITCAAPNAGAAKRNGVSDEEINEIMLERIAGILEVCKDVYGTLVLGAFGCGVFKNDLKFVAEAFNEMTEYVAKYYDAFHYVIPDQASYNTMNETLMGEFGDMLKKFTKDMNDIFMF